MRFGILGALQVQGTRGSVPVLGRKRRLLLIALLSGANDVVSVDQLVDWLWCDRPPRSAVPTLHAHVSALRRVIEPDRQRWAVPETLLTRPTGYLIRVHPDRLDALHFEQLVDRGALALQDGAAADASRLLHQALGLWRGAALAEASFIEAAQAEIARLDQLRLVALMLRAEADLLLGRHLELVPELSRLVRVHPLHEPFYRQLMVALAHGGRRADALAVFQRARDALARELDVEPGPQLRQARIAILAEDPFEPVVATDGPA